MSIEVGSACSGDMYVGVPTIAPVVLLLASIASDKHEDPVIVGRSLDGLAKIGGDSACRLILQSLEHSDDYVRNRAVRALLKLKHPDSIESLSRAATSHSSPW